jgi:hypothetical protein
VVQKVERKFESTTPSATESISFVICYLTPANSPQLIRQRDGQTHQVSVTEEGFEYKGERYKSLSEVARLITGTRWSGPLFFGLKQSEKNRIRS